MDIIFAGGKFRAKSKFANIAKISSTRKMCVIQYTNVDIHIILEPALLSSLPRRCRWPFLAEDRASVETIETTVLWLFTGAARGAESLEEDAALFKCLCVAGQSKKSIPTYRRYRGTVHIPAALLTLYCERVIRFGV